MLILDPAHGGHARAGKSTPLGYRLGDALEKDVNLAICQQIAAQMMIPTALTRTGDHNLSLGQRAARARGAAAFVAVHVHDHLPPGAIRVWTHDCAGPESQRFAQALAARLRGAQVGRALLAVLHESAQPGSAPACMVELAADGALATRASALAGALAGALASGSSPSPEASPLSYELPVFFEHSMSDCLREMEGRLNQLTQAHPDPPTTEITLPDSRGTISKRVLTADSAYPIARWLNIIGSWQITLIVKIKNREPEQEIDVPVMNRVASAVNRFWWADRNYSGAWPGEPSVSECIEKLNLIFSRSAYCDERASEPMKTASRKWRFVILRTIDTLTRDLPGFTRQLHLMLESSLLTRQNRLKDLKRSGSTPQFVEEFSKRLDEYREFVDKHKEFASSLIRTLQPYRSADLLLGFFPMAEYYWPSIFRAVQDHKASAAEQVPGEEWLSERLQMLLRLCVPTSARRARPAWDEKGHLLSFNFHNDIMGEILDQLLISFPLSRRALKQAGLDAPKSKVDTDYALSQNEKEFIELLANKIHAQGGFPAFTAPLNPTRTQLPASPAPLPSAPVPSSSVPGRPDYTPTHPDDYTPPPVAASDDHRPNPGPIVDHDDSGPSPIADPGDYGPPRPSRIRRPNRSIDAPRPDQATLDKLSPKPT